MNNKEKATEFLQMVIKGNINGGNETQSQFVSQ